MLGRLLEPADTADAVARQLHSFSEQPHIGKRSSPVGAVERGTLYFAYEEVEMCKARTNLGCLRPWLSFSSAAMPAGKRPKHQIPIFDSVSWGAR
jgi:hypothetical protein